MRFRVELRRTMKKIEAIIRPSRLEDVKQALAGLGIDAFTMCDVHGGVLGTRQTLVYRCHVFSVDVMPQIKIELVVGARMADDVIRAVIEAAHTGESDDGQVFVSEVSEAIRICNYQRDEAAV
jgi:nitrogen regulatory protein P-II 1